MKDVGPGDYRFEARTLSTDYVRDLFRRRSLDPESLVAKLSDRVLISVVVFHHVDFSQCSSKLNAYVSLSGCHVRANTDESDCEFETLRIDNHNFQVVRSLLEAQHGVKLVEAQTEGVIRLLSEL